MKKLIDRKIEKLGFKLIEDTMFNVRYERYDETHGYTQVVTLCHKSYGKHILQSYDKDLCDHRHIGNTCVGLTYKEARLFLKKMKSKNWHK